MEKDNNFILPINEGSSAMEEAELRRVEELRFKYLLLKGVGLVNSGTRTAILASGANGYVRYSPRESLEHIVAGNSLKGRIPQSDLFKDATSDDLATVIQDLNYKNVIVIGHASYHSWVASDKSVNWYDLGKMIGSHLKDGIFVNVGCGAIHSFNRIPLGYFVVNNPQNLFGKKAEYLYGDELVSNPLGSLQPLNPRLSFI